MIETPKLFKDLDIKGCYKYEDIVPVFLDVINIVEPNNILETGFFCGMSSFLWLYHSKANVTSIDPMVDTPSEKYLKNINQEHLIEDATPKFNGLNTIKKTFGCRFNFIQKYSSDVFKNNLLDGQKFDLFFIDGDHWEDGIRTDLQIALKLKIPWILLDDFNRDVEKVFLNEFQKYYLYPIRVYRGNNIQNLVLLKLKYE